MAAPHTRGEPPSRPRPTMRCGRLQCGLSFGPGQVADSAASNAQALTELPMAGIQQMTKLTTLWCAPRVFKPARGAVPVKCPLAALVPTSRACLQALATPQCRPCCALLLGCNCMYACAPGSTATRAAARLTWSGTRRGCWPQAARWLAAWRGDDGVCFFPGV